MTKKPVATGKTNAKAPAKSKAAKTTIRPAAAKPRKAPIATQPVTLDQARRLAAAAGPKRATRRMLLAAPTVDKVGVARAKLDKQRADEREQRRREYTAVMKIMKQRGAARPEKAAKGRRGGPAKAPKASFQPLQVMAEGDSWFDYPIPLFGGGIVKRLEKRLGVPILNMAGAGDEVRFMLGVDQRKRLVQELKSGCPAGGPWDVMLFSGGGNDIVDNPMALWIRDFDATATPAAHIHQPRFDAALTLVRAGYEDLIALRDQLSPSTHLVFQCYDFAIPDGRGICHHGPWLKPTFDLRKFPSRAEGFAVVKLMLQQFAAMLQSLAGAHIKVTVIHTQGTLAQQTSAWHNELHPAKPGFESFAEMFRQQLKVLFPTRVV